MENPQKQFKDGDGPLTVLSGVGISAESGIPTFRGQESYWTVGSRDYRRKEMATQTMFSRGPWEVWTWYLYSRTVCDKAGLPTTVTGPLLRWKKYLTTGFA